jgi:hypothetical protein
LGADRASYASAIIGGEVLPSQTGSRASRVSQEGRVILGDLGDGAGATGCVLALEDRAAEEKGFRRIGSVVLESAVGPGLRCYGEKVRRAEYLADGLDAAADTRVRTVSIQVLI